MATTVREAIDEEISSLEAEIEELTKAKQSIPSRLLYLEGDSVEHWVGSTRWYRFVDESHPGLCAELMELGFVPSWKGRKRVAGGGMKAEFYLKQDDDYTFVDVVRPSRNCKQVKVRVTEERVIELCGDLPSNYELIEVIGE